MEPTGTAECPARWQGPCCPGRASPPIPHHASLRAGDRGIIPSRGNRATLLGVTCRFVPARKVTRLRSRDRVTFPSATSLIARSFSKRPSQGRRARGAAGAAVSYGLAFTSAARGLRPRPPGRRPVEGALLSGSVRLGDHHRAGGGVGLVLGGPQSCKQAAPPRGIARFRLRAPCRDGRVARSAAPHAGRGALRAGFPSLNPG